MYGDTVFRYESIRELIRVNEDIIRHLTVKLESIMEENKEESVEK